MDQIDVLISFGIGAVLLIEGIMSIVQKRFVGTDKKSLEKYTEESIRKTAVSSGIVAVIVGIVIIVLRLQVSHIIDIGIGDSFLMEIIVLVVCVLIYALSVALGLKKKTDKDKEDEGQYIDED